jgi:uncharacterized protein (TIGR00369 family)
MFKHVDLEAFYNRFCHYDRHMGLKLTVQRPGKITYSLQVEERHSSFLSVCHGGVIAGMMDATLGVTALSWAIEQGKLCATVEFKTHFFTPVKVGDFLEGTGEIDFTGSRLVVTTAHITATTVRQLVAKGMGTFNLYPVSKRKDLLELLLKMQDG